LDLFSSIFAGKPSGWFFLEKRTTKRLPCTPSRGFYSSLKKSTGWGGRGKQLVSLRKN